MALPRSPSLEYRFGCALDDVDVAALDRLVASAARETSDLEFKAELYGPTADDKYELAKDVCALANSQGGAIVLGLEERDGVAVRLASPLRLSETTEQRMRLVVAEHSAPTPSLAIRRVMATPDTGYYLLVVPRSEARPHAVFRKNETALRFPRRYDSDTLYMSESELADSYRDRFAAAVGQVGRLNRVFSETVDWFGASSHRGPWLEVGITPNVRGNLPLTVRTVRVLGTWAQERINTLGLPTMVSAAEPMRVSVRKVIGGGTMQTWERSSLMATHLELHTDGSGFGAVMIGEGINKSGPVISDDQLLFDIAAILDVLAAHAIENAGAWGDAVAAATISNTAKMKLRLVPNAGLQELDAVRFPRSEHTLDLRAVVESREELLAAARMLATDLLQCFGRAEPLSVDAQGRVRIGHVSLMTADVACRWCEDHGVAIATDDPLGS